MSIEYFILEDTKKPLMLTEGKIIVYGDKQEAVNDMIKTDVLGTITNRVDENGNHFADVDIDTERIGAFFYEDNDESFQKELNEFLEMYFEKTC